jgi:hypothetical protein
MEGSVYASTSCILERALQLTGFTLAELRGIIASDNNTAGTALPETVYRKKDSVECPMIIKFQTVQRHTK